MTLRSVILGLLGASGICAFSFFNDRVINQQMLVPHQLPPIVYGGLIFGVLLSGLASRFLGKGRAFTGAEWATTVGLWLVACGIPGWGLMECVPPTAIMTHHYAQIEPGWHSDETDVVANVPERMLADVGSDDGTVLNGYVCGLAEANRHIPLRAVPWANWARTIGFWLPFTVALTIGLFGLAAVVHRQWSEHESLPYPISTFAHALLPGEDGTVAVFRERLFWTGAIPVLILQLNNYLFQWFPTFLIPVNPDVDLSPLYDLLPFLDGPGFSYHLSLAVLGLAYFLRTNVAFSVGIVPYVYTGIAALLTRYGISLTGGDHLGANYNTFLFAGGYLGVFALMLYTGRHYYWNALHQGLLFSPAGDTGTAAARRIRSLCIGAVSTALFLFVFKTGWLCAISGGVATALLHGWAAPGFPVRDPVDGQAVWGMRVFLSAMLVFVALLVWVGLDWQLAILFAAIAVMTFVVVSRAVAETGAFLFGTFFLPGALMLGFAGAVAIGPRTALIMALASSAILLAPGWAPMPFMVQALKLADLGKANVHRTAKCGVAVLLLCAPLALGATLYWSYDRGAPMQVWPQVANQYPGRDMVRMTTRLHAQGALATADLLSGWRRLAHLAPNRPQVLAFGITVSLTLLCGWCGLRFTKWPFHPVMFLFLGSFHGQWISVSLLAGCAVKAGVIRYGGADLYNRLKPLMIGFIAGSVVAATIPMIVGGIYYLVTGLPPPRMPGSIL